MGSIPIRNLDDKMKTLLRVQVARHDCSMEEEVRVILREAVGRTPSSRNLAENTRSWFGP